MSTVRRVWILSHEPRDIEPDRTYLRRTAYLLLRYRFKTSIVEESYNYYMLLNKDHISTKIEISKEVFDDLLTNTIQRPPITEEVFEYELSDYKIIVSHIDGKWWQAEVLFSTQSISDAFVPPNYFKLEITDDPTYSIENYWDMSEREIIYG